MSNPAYVAYLKSTSISHIMTTSPLAWPLCETLHFVGLALLIGGAGLIDLRLMGLMRGVPLRAVMQMRKWAAVGVGINVVTGALFFIGAPDQYIHNPAWKAKLLFLAVAMVNVAIFETTQGKRMLALSADADTPRSFKIAGAVSMASWFLVLYFGRMLPFIGEAF
jgi:hypothetical protein